MFNVNTDVIHIIAQYDNRIYGEFTRDSYINMNNSGVLSDNDKGIICEYDNKVYMALKHQDKTIMYDIIDTTVTQLHEYNRNILGDFMSMIFTGQYPQLHIMHDYKSRIFYSIMINGSGREQIMSNTGDIRNTSNEKWPVMAKYYNARQQMKMALYGNNKTRDFTYIYDNEYICGTLNNHFERNLSITNKNIYYYCSGNKDLRVFNIETKKMVSHWHLMLDAYGYFSQIIVKNMCIFILTHNFSQMDIHVYDAHTGMKINTVRVLTLASECRLAAPKFAITHKYIYVYCVINEVKIVHESAREKMVHSKVCDHIIILKRNVCFINK